MEDIKDFLAHAEESDLRHAYSRWSYATEPQKGSNNRSQFWGNEMAFFDTFNDPRIIKFHRTKYSITSWFYPGGKAGNHYEKFLHA